MAPHEAIRRVADAMVRGFCALPPGAVLLGAVVLFVGLSLPALREDSPTFDEGVYLSAGASYLKTGDFRLNPEQPMLLKSFAALPLLFQDVHLPLSGEAWRRGNEWAFGYQFLYQSGNQPRTMLFSGRLLALFWGLVLIGSVYAVSRERHGALGGGISLSLAVSCPTLLGHAHLVTMDVLVTALIFLSVAAFERWIERRTIWRAAQAGILLAGAFLSKFTALALVLTLPIFFVLLARRRKDEPSPAPPATWNEGPWTLFYLAAATFVTLWAAYQFRFAISPDPSDLPWGSIAAHGSPASWLAAQAWRAGILPEAYLYGLTFQDQHAATGHEAYALGQVSRDGWWWYFPFAFLVKTPLTALALFGWGIVSAVRPPGRSARTMAWLLIPASFGAISLFVKLNLGVRYLLPVVPFLMLFAGGVPAWSDETPGSLVKRRIALGLVLAGLLDAGLSVPYHLSYFNWAARLAAERHELLVDSNLDWGQDLGRLKALMEREGIPEVKLSYFGAASPASYGIPHQRMPGLNLSGDESSGPATEEFLPGDVLAVSATNLVGAYLRDPTFYRRLLGDLHPFAVAGTSIYLFRIPRAR